MAIASSWFLAISKTEFEDKLDRALSRLQQTVEPISKVDNAEQSSNPHKRNFYPSQRKYDENSDNCHDDHSILYPNNPLHQLILRPSIWLDLDTIDEECIINFNTCLRICYSALIPLIKYYLIKLCGTLPGAIFEALLFICRLPPLLWLITLVFTSNKRLCNDHPDDEILSMETTESSSVRRAKNHQLIRPTARDS